MRIYYIPETKQYQSVYLFLSPGKKWYLSTVVAVEVCITRLMSSVYDSRIAASH